MHPLTAAPQGRDRHARRARLAARLGGLTVVGASLVALQVGMATLASADAYHEYSATGNTEAEARQKFDADATQVCISYGGYVSHTLLGTTQQGTQYLAEGFAICKN